jgi:predicted DNA-binding transcriptional regulator AlpA
VAAKYDELPTAVLPRGQFLRAVEVARRLNISKSAAYRLMRESLPSYWFGPGVVRVLDADLDRFIQNSVALRGEN